MKSLGPRGANWDLGATGQKWSLRLESPNFWSGCMERKVARSLGEKGLRGLPAGMNAEAGTIGPSHSTEMSLTETAHFWGREGQQKEEYLCTSYTVSGLVFFICFLNTDKGAKQLYSYSSAAIY